MITNELQRRIAAIETKLNTLGIKQFYDPEYNYSIKYNDLKKQVFFISNDEDLEHIDSNVQKESLIIDLSNDSKYDSIEVINESNIDLLLSISELIDTKTMSEIIEYLFFKKNNETFFNIIKNFATKKEKTYISNNDLQKDENTKNNENILSIINLEFKKQGPFKKKKGKKYFISDDKKTAILAMVSKRYNRVSYKYWFTFHKYQKDFLEDFESSYVMLYFVDKEACVIIEAEKLYSYLDKLNKTIKGDNIGWHLHVQEKNNVYQLRIPKQGTVSLKDATFENDEELVELDIKPSNSIKLSLDDYRVVRIKK